MKKNIDEDLDSPDKDNESVLKDDKIEGDSKEKHQIPKKEKRKKSCKESFGNYSVPSIGWWYKILFDRKRARDFYSKKRFG